MKQSIIVVLIVVCLLTGIVGGYGVGYTIYQPKIKTYENQVSSLTSEVSRLQLNLTEAQKTTSNYESQISTLQTDLSNAQKTMSDYETQVSSLKSLNSNLQSQIAGLQAQIATLQSQVSTLQNQLKTLQTQYDALQTQYIIAQNSLNAIRTLSIGTTLETYYDYVRANCYTIGFQSVGEEKWSNYPNYYNISVTFAADLASHDIGNLWWPSLDTDSGYYNYMGEYSYQTSSRIMQSAMTLANVSSTDSNVMKIEKVLTFVSSIVHYENKLLDHMWFPCETLTFRSGDCTSFSILAASMFEEAGIKSAVGFFTNSTLGAHAMVLVHLNDLDSHGYWYYSDLISYNLTSGRWIIIEPQYASLTEQDAHLYDWIGYWALTACAEVPYGP